MDDLIDRKELLNNRPEYLNPKMEDEIQSARHKGWNDCNSYYYDLIIKQPKADTSNYIKIPEEIDDAAEKLGEILKLITDMLAEVLQEFKNNPEDLKNACKDELYNELKGLLLNL